MKKLLSLLVIAAAAVACTEDDLGSDVYTSGPKIVGFGTSFESVAYFEDEGTVQRDFAVNLIGLGNGQVSDQPITVNYEIVADQTTATEGQEFDFVDSSGSITIPAGSDFGVFPLAINTGSFSQTEKTQLVIKLTTASDGTVVGQQQSTLRVVFVGCQSQLQGEYTLQVVRQDGFVRNYPAETIIPYMENGEVVRNTFHTESSGTYLQGQFAVPDQGFNFVDICGEITVPEQNLANYYSNLLRGISSDGIDGHVIDENQFELTYEITFAAGNQTYTGTYTRNN